MCRVFNFNVKEYWWRELFQINGGLTFWLLHGMNKSLTYSSAIYRPHLCNCPILERSTPAQESLSIICAVFLVVVRCLESLESIFFLHMSSNAS